MMNYTGSSHRSDDKVAVESDDEGKGEMTRFWKDNFFKYGDSRISEGQAGDQL